MLYLNRGRLIVTRLTISSRAFSIAAEEKATTSAVQPSQIQNLKDVSRRIEKISLSRGLAMNKFEKDFLIYPEYADSDDVEAITGYVASLRNSLEVNVNAVDIEESKSLTSEVQESLKNNKLLATFVPAEFGGLGMCRKDICKIYEELGLEWNVFAHVSTTNLASHLLVLYGSEEQKSIYLPKLATGECKPLFMNIEYTNAEGMIADISKNVGVSSTITLTKVPVFSQSDANLAFVFATSKQAHTGTEHFSCYLIDKTLLKPTDKWNFTRDHTMGLKGVEFGTIDICGTVRENNFLGLEGNGEEVKSEIISGRIAPLAATSVGYSKRVLADLANYCNRSPSRSRQMMSSSPAIQRHIASISLNLYSLESALYYVSGLLDEGVPSILDIENALLLKMSRALLLESIQASVEIFGLCSNESSQKFEKNIRDVTAILGLFTEGDTKEQISIATLSTWVTNKKSITGTIKRFLRNEKMNAAFNNPKLQHYIAEHAHPSLQFACQALEFSMSRVNAVIEKMVAEQGKNVAQDYGSLEGLTRVFENHLCMVSTISRASRSYSIGLRNADLELAWATLICSRLSRDNWFQLETLSDYFGLIKLNPSITNAGRAVLDMSGYPIESPIEKNW